MEWFKKNYWSRRIKNEHRLVNWIYDDHIHFFQ
ncbi:type II toxin-antitoxin system YoeB family toxin [Jiulongibacter sediminis]